MSYVQEVLASMKPEEFSLAAFPEAFEKAASAYIVKLVKEGKDDHAKLIIGEDLRNGKCRHYGNGENTIDVDVLENVIHIYSGDSNQNDDTFSYDNDESGILAATKCIMVLLKELP